MFYQDSVLEITPLAVAVYWPGGYVPLRTGESCAGMTSQQGAFVHSLV